MSADVLGAVLLALRTLSAPIPDLPADYSTAPVFRRLDDGTVEHVSGRPDITHVSLDLIAAADDALGWDGECLTMPGGLRYRPTHLHQGTTVMCERVGP
jgi:hypothetical protein